MHYLPFGTRLNKGILMVTQLILGFRSFFASGHTKGTQRHFRRLSYFARSAYPSVLRPSNPYADKSDRKSPKYDVSKSLVFMQVCVQHSNHQTVFASLFQPITREKIATDKKL